MHCCVQYISLIIVYKYAFQSYDNFSRGDFENGKRQGQWSLGLNVSVTFFILVIIAVATEACIKCLNICM